MATFGLWRFKWNGSNYESRMNGATVQDFKNRGFDYLIALDGEGNMSNYTGNGYNDGRELAEFLSDKLSGIQYYAPIPFYQYGAGNKNARDNPQGSFDNSYWQKWIDAFLSSSDPNLLGFYWSLESVLQTTTGYGAGKVSVGLIEGLSQYVRGHGFKLLWIPALGGRTVDYLKKKSSLGDDPSIVQYNIRQYFNYIFCQPNYYQNSRMTPTNTLYEYNDLKNIVDWIYEGQMYIEMEADKAILGIPEHCRCGTGGCCKEYASHYIKAQKDVLGSKFYHRAYYFSTDLRVIDEMEDHCQNNLGEHYV
ncbi:DUF4855 domain-containing protein [Palaeococcus sp. (in: euryarchaeotes)]